MKEEMELDEELYGEIRTEILVKRAKKRAMYLLQKMDRTEAQIRQKLKTDLYSEDIIDEVIEYLYSFHYLDDARYIENYVRHHSDSKSNTALKQALMQKGISRELIEQQLEGCVEKDEAEKIAAILQKKHFIYEEADEKQRNRIYRYLLSKGFRYEDILRAVKLAE